MTVGLAGAGVAAYGEDTTDQSQSATTAAQDATAAAEGVDAPQYAKRISKNDDGTYTLSMDVTGKSSESTEQQVVPLDIALVLDVSGSMDESIGGGSSTTRLQALKQAVTSFLSQVEDQNQRINDNTKKVQVALIKYAGDNSNTIGNQRYCSGVIGPITGTCYYGEWCNYSQTVHSLAWEPGQLQQERDYVEALQAGGATRADFGLLHAVAQLNDENLGRRPGAQKLTIFYSDGSPTSSSEFDTTVADAAITAARQLKAGTSQVISIGAMSGANPDGTDNANKFMNYVSSNYPDAQSMSEPGARGEGTYYYAVSASTDLQTIFDKIISMVTSGTAYQDVTMTDTLSDYVEFSQPVVQNFGAELVIRDKDGHRVDPSAVGLAGYTITAQLGSKTISISFPQGYALKDGYTYSLEYKIVPSAKAYEEYAANVNAGKNGYGENPSVGADDTGVSSAGQQGFLSNERATIDYRPRVNGEPQVLVEGKYPHPVIQVDTTQFANLSIHKAWIATNPERDKVIVDVTCKDAAGGECTGYRGIDISKSSNWTSTVLIPKADADRTYTVTEHALSGFRTDYTNREITIPADTAVEYRSTVTNYPVAINFNLNQIRVGKTVQGTDTNQDFTFTLSPDPDNAEGVTNADGTPFTNATLTLGDHFTNGTQVTGAFADTSITLPTPEAGQEATYTFNIAENAPSPSAGWAADTDAPTVTVTVGAPTAEGTIPTTVTYHYAADDADGTAANKNLAAFTNHWIAVSQLPLTGEGGATPLLWLVIGGGLGVLALLTAGGVAIWRTRRLI
ncbi:VWA domain-containing protein [Bifidobacterium sp.]|uniref:DUF7604 domain-containing protein n=1 Tax=Bifidobacterium sp. TaxID=41200 RepID=UPI00386C22F5